MMSESDVRVTVRLDQGRAAWCGSLAERALTGGGVGVGLRLAAVSLEGLLSVELRGTGTWTVPQLTLLAEGYGQVMIQPDAYGQLLAHELEAMITDFEAEFEAKHGLADGGARAVLDRARELSPAQDLAVRDALSRWWDAQSPTGDEAADGFRAVGFRVL